MTYFNVFTKIYTFIKLGYNVLFMSNFPDLYFELYMRLLGLMEISVKLTDQFKLTTIIFFFSVYIFLK